jgi:hypothetical protein
MYFSRSLSPVLFAIACGFAAATGLPVKAAPGIVTNDVFFKDTAGHPIYSQGGGIFKFGDTYYWYGVKYEGAVTYYENPTRKIAHSRFNAITCYASTDLVNWTFKRNVLTAASPGLEGSRWVGRMGVAYNRNTKTYVLVSQFTGKGGAGELFATSATPDGEFTFHHIQRSIENVVTGRTGDQTVFIDDDGAAYLIACSSKGRDHLYVSRLRPDDFLHAEPAVEISTGAGREGNCMFKYKGRYYFCSSDLHGWNASPCYVLEAASILGPYAKSYVMPRSQLDFCHVTQTGFFVTVQGSAATTVLFCGDRWSDFAGNGLGYNIWCPLSFEGTTPVFQSVNRFTLDAAAGTWRVAPGNNYLLNPSFEADRVPQATLAGWTTDTNAAGRKPRINVLDPHTGRWSLRQMPAESGEALTHQIVTGLPNGAYTLKAWVKSSGGQKVAEIFARGFGGKSIGLSLNQPVATWKDVTVSTAIHVTNGRCDVGVRSVGDGNQWMVIDDLSLIRNDDPALAASSR